MPHRTRLHHNGYALLRQAIPGEWLAELRNTFDSGLRPSEQWPVPRGADWQHSMLDDDARVQALCRLPQLLAVVGELIGERFFLTQVEGREPVAGGGHQRLHRDMSAQRPGDTVGVLAYLDDYGPQNGATRIVPASHRPDPQAPPFDWLDESGAVQLSGQAGDLLVFDVDLVHAASLNHNGARRRTLLIGYATEQLRDTYAQTASLRNVRMDTTERFEPADFALAVI